MKEYYLLGADPVFENADNRIDRTAALINDGDGELYIYRGDLEDLLDEVSYWGTYEKITEERFHKINALLEDKVLDEPIK